MTKKKQSKRSAKQGAKKTSGSGVAPTLHEIPAIEQPQASQDAQALSAPEPIVTEPAAPDLAAQPSSATSIAAAVTNELTSPSSPPATSDVSPTDGAPSGYRYGLSESATPVQDTTASPQAAAIPTVPVPPTEPTAPTPPTEPTEPTPPTERTPSIAPAPLPEPSPAPQSQKTAYDIEAQPASVPDIAAVPNPPMNASVAPALNPQSLGSLTRSKSSSEVSRGLPSKEDPGAKWRPPVDYFGASASAFSSSFTGNQNRDPNTIQRPGDAPQAPAASIQAAASTPTNPQNPPVKPVEPPVVYQPATDTSALSPKMAKFVAGLRERELTASGASSPVLPQLEATSVEIAPISTPQPPQPAQQPQPQATPPEITPVVSAKQTEPKPASGPVIAETSRDLPAIKLPTPDGPRPEPKTFTDDPPLAPKSSSQVAELRESIISQRADGKSEDWHPVPTKKPPRADRQLSAELEDFKKPESKQKPEAERHLSLEEMAVMENPDMAFPAQTPQQQSIRRLKSKTTGGIHAEIYIPIYLICLGLGWVTEQSAVSGTCRDAGQRIESSLQLLAPKPLADNFIAGLNAYDDREIKLHPFNPNKRPNVIQVILGRILAFCSGLSSAFGRIPATIAASSASNPLAEIMILLTYTSIFVLSLLIFFKFKRSVNWSIADFILLPIGLIAASTLITAVLIAVLSMSASLAAGYLPNTIILYTTVAVVLAVLDMARRSFLGRKQAIVRD